MKKHLLFAVLFSGSAAALAQQTIPNGNFENWNTFTMEQPQNWWRTSNNDLMENGIYTNFNTTRTTDAQMNTYAIRMETITINSGQDTIFGYFTNGDPDNMTGGVPYAQTPTALTGYWKGSIMPGDTGLLFVAFKLNGVMISFNTTQFYGNAATYTMFSIPITLPPMTTPDSVIVAAASSNAFVSQGIPGSWLQIDNLQFTGVTTQPPMNGDFELWNINSFYRPQSWGAFGDSLFRTTDSYAGTYAVRMETYAYDPQNNGITSSYITNGTLGQNGFEGGQPYTLQVDTLCGWYKYSASSADSGVAFIQFKNNGNIVGMVGIPFAPAATYTYFELPFVLPSAPDTALIIVTSTSNTAMPADVGNTLTIDELQFKSQPLNTSIRPFDWAGILALNVWPNPNNGQFTVSFHSGTNDVISLLVTDALGRTIRDLQLNGTGTIREEIDLSNEEKGMYFVRVKQGEKTFTKKIIVR